MFGKINISNKSMVAVKLSLIAFSVVALAISLSLLVPVLAEHTATVTITPHVANCDALGNTFTVNVRNDGGSTDDLIQVEIYKALTGISDFDCGTPPTGWDLFSYTDRCIYVTELGGDYKIEPGEDLDFTFDATMSSDTCQSLFIVVTVDDAYPTGDRDTHNLYVDIDCVDPVIEKSITSGSYYGVCPPDTQQVGEECWMSCGTIHVTASDDADECDLGIDYCDWDFTVDGTPYDSGHEENGDTLEWDIIFDEDSEHVLTITCYDNAGNSVSDVETFVVDCTPPETTKDFFGPKKIENGVEWIDGVTLVKLTATDDIGPHDSGVAATYYYNQLACGDNPCWSISECESWKYKHPYREEFTPYDGSFPKEGECCHILWYYSIDEVGNVEGMNVNCFFVDTTEPYMDKDNGQAIRDIGEPMFMTKDNPDGVFHWITSSMPITFTCDDTWDENTELSPHPSEGEELCFKVSYDYVEIEPEVYDWGYITETYCTEDDGRYMNEEDYCCVPVDGNKEFEFYFNSDEESLHNLEYYCIDAVEKDTDVHIQYYKVDDTPPTTEKIIDPEPYILEGAEYIDTANDISFRAVDGGEICDIGVDKTWYANLIDLTEQSCSEPETYCVPADVPGTAPYEVMGCIDAAQEECSYLESPDFEACVERFAHGECQVDPLWKLYDGTPIQKSEESCHMLHYFSVDDLGNVEEMNVNCFFVDKRPPEIDKNYIGPHKEVDGIEWIDGVTEIELIVTDPEPHPSGVALVEYRFTLVGDEACESESRCQELKIVEGEEPIPYIDPFIIGEESCHLIEVYAEDNVGKSSYHRQCVFVDKTEPYMDKDNGQAIWDDGEPMFVTEDNPDGVFHWITSNMPIIFTCDDTWDENTELSPHPSEGEELCFKVSYDYPDWYYITKDYCDHDLTPEGYCCEPVDENKEFEFYFNCDEESMHNLEYYCVDAVEKDTDPEIQYYKVDDTPPTTEKIIDPEPYILEGAEYIDTANDISFRAVDGGEICDIGVDKTWYKNVIKEIDLCKGDCNDGPHGYDYCYHPELYCNEQYLSTMNPYDNPDTEYCINKAQVLCEGDLMGQDNWYECVEEYAKTQCGDDNLDPEWYLYDDTPIQKGEESCHILYYFSIDELGNIEDMQYNCFFVDKEPPVTKKWYEGPHYENDGEWITSETEVWLEADDEAGPHVSGVKATYYRDIYFGEEDEDKWHYCSEDCYNWDPKEPSDPLNPESEGWTKWEGKPFYKSPESCHIIEYYSVDNVDKVEDIKWQCVFVDNSAPEPYKEVGEPKAMWDGKDSYFYPDETVHCWDGTGEEIECWKVTMMTPITLDCVDPDPHPVDHEEVCFMVDLDGCDETESYCDMVGGEYNEITGWCCGKNAPYEFKFNEETEHNLKYYCVDALENKGPIDEEKFKVEGTKFEIPLYKKWNLISVPFVLLDDNPEAVFDKLSFDGEVVEDVEDYVDSVWTYDPEHAICGFDWCVWSPGEAPDNLRIEPGWGYWVLVTDKPEDCEEEDPRCFWNGEEPLWLVIGGSLFSPATTPPSRDLVKGWNLIGYYGSSWELYSLGDASYQCGDYWDVVERYIYGDKVYCALNSLVDTQEGYPRWSSLWSYLNCGNHLAFWLGLNTCADPDNPLQSNLDRMYAGRGYWLELDVEDIYAPATTCIWNSDFECRWTGGGVLP